MSPQGVMSSEKTRNSPGVSPVEGQKPSLGTQARYRYFRLNKEPFGYVHALMGSDILADGCNAQKPLGSTEQLASLHVNQGDEIFTLLGIYAA